MLANPINGGNQQQFEDGTNIAVGTPYRLEFTSRILPWYSPEEAKASSNWKDKWITLRSRFERIIDECCPLECVMSKHVSLHTRSISTNFQRSSKADKSSCLAMALSASHRNYVGQTEDR